MYLVGITGFIGSGKTTVGNILKDLGYIVFDMDVWCRNMYKDTKFLNIIKKNFPLTFENGIFNKKILRNLVFSNNNELQKLENLTHPYLKNKLLNIIHQNRFNHYIFFIETALLYQMKLDKFCSSVIITEAPYDIMLQRTVIRDNIQPEDFKNIFEKQKIQSIQKNSYYKINTNKSLSLLKKDVIKIVKRIPIC